MQHRVLWLMWGACCCGCLTLCRGLIQMQVAFRTKVIVLPCSDCHVVWIDDTLISVWATYVIALGICWWRQKLNLCGLYSLWFSWRLLGSSLNRLFFAWWLSRFIIHDVFFNSIGVLRNQLWVLKHFSDKSVPLKEFLQQVVFHVGLNRAGFLDVWFLSFLRCWSKQWLDCGNRFIYDVVRSVIVPLESLASRLFKTLDNSPALEIKEDVYGNHAVMLEVIKMLLELVFLRLQQV